ncbi:flagellar assembly peptidoglycan hydrolase FlgJ [Sulfuriferula sp. AH1]|uniref:flagellar assembly peptidoglycan hydrolase FlgJ n=1 Tax=Sulfuriferula sp. AH1 TaxID=1985873 RepID=UPI000B3B1D2A|nr:flagellar assembly peptidoglycan hydrolase FlgJ [Sulfuriferula sp. AH1]ARU31691.1 flagellar assembly peptidoglycan hydrolase FlgJ [Sulfuriferula sp. AH1]
MISSTDITSSLAVDTQGLAELRRSAKDNSPEAIKTVAKQFEAVFMNMMLKSMREATSQDGMFDNEQSRLYTSMLDQQLSQSMASRGIGLADVLTRQLSAFAGAPLAAAASAKAGIDNHAAAQSGASDSAAQSGHLQSALARSFQNKLRTHAEEASRTTGIPAKFMLGQAALESGWGRKEILTADGSTSHNLFGIKAGSSWNGKTVDAVTTEYVNGVAHRRVEKFRAYDSYADSFRDYAHLLRSNPRYQNVIANAHDVAGFAQGLQQAGYATDPHYADKLTKIINQSLSA